MRFGLLGLAALATRHRRIQSDHSDVRVFGSGPDLTPR
jgi:hypothetical protein